MLAERIMAVGAGMFVGLFYEDIIEYIKTCYQYCKYCYLVRKGAIVERRHRHSQRISWLFSFLASFAKLSREQMRG